MKSEDAYKLVEQHVKRYRNSTEGVMVSNLIFSRANGNDFGVIFDAMMDIAETTIGGAVKFVPAPQGWIRMIPQNVYVRLVLVQ